MTWVKIKDGRIDKYYNGKYIENDETHIRHSNPTATHMIECGYRELVPVADTETLENKDGYYIDTIFEDNGTQAVAKQIYVEAPQIEESEDEDESFE